MKVEQTQTQFTPLKRIVPILKTEQVIPLSCYIDGRIKTVLSEQKKEFDKKIEDLIKRNNEQAKMMLDSELSSRSSRDKTIREIREWLKTNEFINKGEIYRGVNENIIKSFDKRFGKE